LNVIFDFDGTLADTMRGLERAAVAVIARWYDVPRDEARAKYRDTIGQPFPMQLVEAFGSYDIRACSEFEYMKRHLYQYAKPCPQAPFVLSELVNKGMRTAVVSSTNVALVKDFAERNALALCDITGLSIGMDKAALIRTLKHVHGYELFVGDAIRDAEYARRAGIRFLGVCGTFSNEDWERAGLPHVAVLKGVLSYAGA